MNIKDYNKLKRTEELEEALTNHDGAIPILLKPFSDYLEYEENLKKKKLWDKVIEEFHKIRLEQLKADDDDKFLQDELKRWLEQNKEFEKLLTFEE